MARSFRKLAGRHRWSSERHQAVPRVPFWSKVQTEAYWSHSQQCPACCGGLRSGRRVEPCFVALCVSISNNRPPAFAETALSAASLPNGRAYPSSSLRTLVGDYKRTRHRRLGLIICASHLPIIRSGSRSSAGNISPQALADWVAMQQHSADATSLPLLASSPRRRYHFEKCQRKSSCVRQSISTWLT